MAELALKAALRLVGVDPPRWHDVEPVLIDHSASYPSWFSEQIPRLAQISHWLRREREFAFYGDIDAIPTESYSRYDAQRAVEDALHVLERLEKLVADRTEDR